MRRSQLADERLDLLVRQFDYLLDQGSTAEEALEKLRATVPDDMQPLTRRLAEVVNRATSGTTRDPGPFGLLSRAILLATGAGAEARRTLPPMLKLTRELRNVARHARRSFLAKLLYSGFLAFAGLLVSLLFALVVIPAQRNYADGLAGTEIPAYLVEILHLGILGYPLVFAVILLLVLLAAAFVVAGTSQLARGNPRSRALAALPGFGQLGVAVRSRAALALCDALLVAGAEQNWVMGEVRKLARHKRLDATIEALELAAKNATLAQEIAHQQGANLTDMAALAERCGMATVITLKALVMLALAHLIVSAYIPIIRLANFMTGAPL